MYSCFRNALAPFWISVHEEDHPVVARRGGLDGLVIETGQREPGDCRDQGQIGNGAHEYSCSSPRGTARRMWRAASKTGTRYPVVWRVAQFDDDLGQLPCVLGRRLNRWSAPSMRSRSALAGRGEGAGLVGTDHGVGARLRRPAWVGRARQPPRARRAGRGRPGTVDRVRTVDRRWRSRTGRRGPRHRRVGDAGCGRRRRVTAMQITASTVCSDLAASTAAAPPRLWPSSRHGPTSACSMATAARRRSPTFVLTEEAREVAVARPRAR